MDILKIREHINKKGYPDYRFNQVKDAVFSNAVASFKEIKNIPESLREELEKNFRFYSIKNVMTLSSKKENALKFLFELKDGYRIETMIFEKEKDTWVACISSQVGCPVGCKFCASGKKGLKRNLNYDEISDQVLFAKNYIAKNLSGEIKRIVYMGIGESLFNYENLSKSISILNNYFNIGKRHISVSTFGYIPRIRDFARDFPQVNLAISLHSAVDKTREELVPFSEKYPLKELSRALKDYLDITKRKIFIEYVMLKGINDRQKDVYKIINFIDSISKRKYFTVNLIPYNQTDLKFLPSSRERISEFCNMLISEGVNSTIRKSFGVDIKGACGQLAIK
ncbi:MAG: 23S rRNA (adenine(2503)-C(2))-methyltransferase RlmN [Elusimicrobiales bacterium]|nr:23S rRNA (adenine(2503)-C(2))-methyltransferase RlmN [Elusimicrobiales bacterium]NLH39861.1 23S rRNA (adenine(2503)-C(2))-methyltransferase RlmN [Elusimicrobiota bacterium]